VQGTGAVGLSVVALGRVAGAATIAAIGAPDRRLALATAMGADLTLDLQTTTADERSQVVREATEGAGADIVVEAAGSARAVEEGLSLVRDGGVYVIAGHYTEAGVSHISAHAHINRKHLDLRGCWGSEPRHFLQAVRLLGRHAARVPWRSIGTRVYGLGELQEALADAEAMRVTKAIVRPNPVGAT
jgi:L-iditol 2-dehydrogenase